MNDETNESIVVVSPSIVHNSSVSNNSDGDSIRVIRDPISHPTSMASKSVVTLNQESSEGFQLEAELNRMRAQLNQVKNENAILRQRLEAASESSSRGLSTSPKVTQQHLHSPDEFIDIGAYSIAEQIERYLAQTDTLYNDDIQLRPAMEYLIKKVWSIIAHEYDEKSLENSRKLRDSLLIKLNRTCETFSCVDMLENELERMKRDTFTLKDKVIKQHELIKSLLTVSMQKRNESMVNGLPNSTQDSFVNIASIKQQQQQQQQQQQPIAIEHTNGKHEPEDDDDETESPSPNISPSASFSSHLDRLLNNDNKRNEVRTIDTLSTIETTSMYSSANQQEDDSTLQHEEQQPMNTNATNDTTPEQQQQQQQQQPQQPQYPHQPQQPQQQQQPQQTRAPNDFILYGVNGGDYIGVGRTVEVDNSRLQNYLESPPTNNQQPTTSTRANANTINPPPVGFSTGSTWFYQCPKCKTAIDPGKIRWENFVEHMNTCDAEHNDVCMFCLMSFPKDDNPDLFVEHVQSHFETEF